MAYFRLFKTLANIITSYLLVCGAVGHLALLGLYCYDKAILYTLYEKAELKIKLSLNPNALAEEQQHFEQQQTSDIAANFSPWSPQPPVADVPDHTLKIGTQTYSRFSAATQALKDGQTLYIGPGIYPEALVIVQSQVQIIGVGHVILDGGTAEGKAAIITKGHGIGISNLECRNISVPDQNGACVRSEGQGLDLNHVYFHDSEEGVLTHQNTTLHIRDSRFERLGKAGRAHGLYVDGDELAIEGSLVLSSVSEGHEVKSRAAKTFIKNSVIASLSGNDSRLLDIPNGGELTIINSVLEKGPASKNQAAIGYGLEGITHDNNSVTLKQNVIILERDRLNVLLDISPSRPVPVTTHSNVVVARESLTLEGFNWPFKTRQEAKMEAYPKLPVIDPAAKF